MTKPPAAERPRLTLEDYILFFTTHSGKGLTIDLLNQILFMHGFSKCQSNKSLIVDSLNSVDLLRPRRSTVSTNAGAPPPPLAAAAVLSTEDLRRDVEEVGWRACPVGSVLSIPPAALMPPPPALAPGVAAKRKRGPTGTGKAAIKRRAKRMADLLTLPSVEDMSADWQGETAVTSAMV